MAMDHEPGPLHGRRGSLESDPKKDKGGEHRNSLEKAPKEVKPREKFVSFEASKEVPVKPVTEKRKRHSGKKDKRHDPTLPYWEIELLKGASHLHRHEIDFRKYKLRQRRIEEWVRRKSSIYITSGGDDLSLRSFASIYDGPVPKNVSPALCLLNGIDKLMLLPKALIYDAIMPWNSNTSQFFVLMDATGHNRYRLEVSRHCCKKPQIGIYDTFLHHKLGKIQRRGMNLTRRSAMEVYSPPENLVGTVEYTWKCHPTFHVKDENGRILYIIRMDKLVCCVEQADAKKINFTVRSPNGTVQGQIRADWDDLTYILYLSRKLYGISFPENMNVVHKLLLATANILVYYAFYEAKVLKQVIHIHKPATKAYIEYQVLCGNDNDACLDGLSTISSGSETNVVRPLVDLETAR